jgi:hypothetical protein
LRHEHSRVGGPAVGPARGTGAGNNSDDRNPGGAADSGAEIADSPQNTP